MDKIIFKHIENKDIFVSDYQPLARNNEIIFSNEGIAVIYGPNGTGKTSLVKALSSEKGTNIKYLYNEQEYTDESQFFVINDQTNRNIIKGETKDFLLGDDIKKEFALQEEIEKEYKTLCAKSIDLLKNDFSITSSSSKAIEYFSDFIGIKSILKDLMNSKSKGAKTSVSNYISELEKNTQLTLCEFDANKLNYMISDLSTKNPLLIAIEKLNTKTLSSNPQIKELEENIEAIKILKKFNHKDQCVVCDFNGINPEELLNKKDNNQNLIKNGLDGETRKIVEKILSDVGENDPFKIKDSMLDTIETGDLRQVQFLQESIAEYKKIFVNNVIFGLVRIYKDSTLKDINDEYQRMLSQKPEIEEEDYLYIEQIINNNMSKKLEISRDENKNIKIKLEDKEFLGVDRNELPLSTGEQNFLSLTFEFLKAKRSDKPIIILDDPISSFDSIYKNKIAYAIIKILENKKRIVLTHNIDLLRLLDGQFKRCFSLFLFNNTENEENGFIKLNANERNMLINLDGLLNYFRKKVFKYIKNTNYFLISLIPFMRGYSMLINDDDAKEKLTQLMHGYKTEEVDIAEIYIKLFGNQENSIPDNYKIRVNNILELNTDEIEIIDKDEYPLLNRTLIHSFTYLYLRLLIEKILVSKYNIDTESRDGAKQLGQIISKAFPENTKNRVFLTTKKTLLNEFNHFEGNLSIFQPAIDISNSMLKKEKADIIAFVNEL